MRAVAIGAFVLDGAAAVSFLAMMALGEGRITPFDGFILTALLVGFLSALSSVMLMDQQAIHETATLILTGAAMFDRLPDAAKRELRPHFPPTVPAAGPGADPSRHLEILMQPSVDGNAVSNT